MWVHHGRNPSGRTVEVFRIPVILRRGRYHWHSHHICFMFPFSIYYAVQADLEKDVAYAVAIQSDDDEEFID